MRTWSEALGGWLFDHYALSTVLLIAVVAFASRLRQPARRLLVVRSGLVGLTMLAVLAATPGWPRARWRVEPVQTPTAIGPEQRNTTAMPAPLAAPEEMPLPSSTVGETAPKDEGKPRPPAVAAPAIASAPDWPDLVGRAFLAGLGLMLAWLGVGCWLTEATRSTVPAGSTIAREALEKIADGRVMPELLVSDGIGQPVAVGLMRPAIILPSRFIEEEPPDRLDAALAHE